LLTIVSHFLVLFDFKQLFKRFLKF